MGVTTLPGRATNSSLQVLASSINVISSFKESEAKRMHALNATMERLIELYDVRIIYVINVNVLTSRKCNKVQVTESVNAKACALLISECLMIIQSA